MNANPGMLMQNVEMHLTNEKLNSKLDKIFIGFARSIIIIA